MSRLKVGRLRTHEVRELEGDGLVVAAALRRLKLHPQFVELDREETDRHVPVETLGVGPALHTVLVRQLLVDREERVKLVVVDVSVLEGACVDIFMDPVEDLVPFPLVLLYRDGLLLGQVAAGRVDRLLAVDPRGVKVGSPPETSLHWRPIVRKDSIAPLVARLISPLMYQPPKLSYLLP